MITQLTDIPEVAAYLARINAEPRSLQKAVVIEKHGRYWRDIAVVRFSRSGEIKTTQEEYIPTNQEKKLIKEAFESVVFPELVTLPEINEHNLPLGVSQDDNLFVFRNMEGEVVMLQQRRETKKGKVYIPFTYWNDGRWRTCEPEGELPLYNLPELARYETVFIHEGAKAARTCSRLVRDDTGLAKHPWGRQLGNAAHIGWIAGALSPGRTDWAALNRSGVKRAYIVPDNDWPGRSAVPAISQRLRCLTFSVEFNNQFPESFDLADDFPQEMFREGVYTGPKFDDCLHPATWATDAIQKTKKGRPSFVLRDSFKKLWVYIEDSDLFICREMPTIIRRERILNKMVMPYSHSLNTSQLILKAQRGRTVKMTYRPDIPKLVIADGGSSAINTYVAPKIEPNFEESPEPFLDFLRYLVINKQERHEVKRWIATLIAKPEIRIGYALLMITENQGVGKTTLGANILAPLVGWNNASVPSEIDIISQFNAWIARKRLAVINEIYTGSSWKSYNILKSVITDKNITINEKYIPQYSLENWCHLFACSNSRKALKVEDGDRRWFYPELTENRWDHERFLKFHKWLNITGLGVIQAWAERFGDTISPAEHAPMTQRKKRLIEESKSGAIKEAGRIAGLMVDRPEAVVLIVRDVIECVKRSVREKVYDTPYQFKKEFASHKGVYIYEKRVKFNGLMQYVFMNRVAFEKVSKISDKRKRVKFLRSVKKLPQEIGAGGF